MIRVVANGCFDVFHYGHLAHLKAARALGDHLTVVLTGDAYINKGPGRPVFSEEHRAEILCSLRCVDEVVISQADTPMLLLEKLRPDIYVKGAEYRGRLPEQQLMERIGCKVVFTDTIVFSSTALLGWL